MNKEERKCGLIDGVGSGATGVERGQIECSGDLRKQ